MVEVIFLNIKDDRHERKGNGAYFFRNTSTNQLYKWSTSKNNHYGILENRMYFINFTVTDEKEDNAIRIKNVRIYEKLGDGTFHLMKNRNGTYKEWI